MRLTPTLLVALVVVELGCSAKARVIFRPSDPMYSPRRVPPPPVYFDASKVPTRAMRSIGIIEVSVPERRGMSAATDAAVVKAQDIGCEMLVEHAAFEKLGGRTGWLLLSTGASVYYAHGVPSGPTRAARPHDGTLTITFECVVAPAASSA